VSRSSPTAEFASLVYGQGGVSFADPAETFHEASRLYPHLAPGRLRSILARAPSPELQQTVARSSRTHAHRPTVELPLCDLSGVHFRDLLARRRSSVPTERRPLPLADLGLILGSSYAATPRGAEGLRRPIPSAGALYPLELYVIALAVEGVEPSVLHYNPFRHCLSLLGPLTYAGAREAVVDGSLVDRATAVVVVTALFWRSRFKYGARGYRFVLLEAGHLVQNAVLAAASLDLPALPLGGFFDRRLDALVGADGLDEASVYAFLVGGRG
jgi:SagB-type dehydrogenase family enzyme